jgi:hypothetical protein
MKERTQGKARSRRNKSARSGDYRFLLPSNVQMPEMRVDSVVWDRIVDGLPRRYVIPDSAFMDWMERHVKESKEADTSIAN